MNLYAFAVLFLQVGFYSTLTALSLFILSIKPSSIELQNVKTYRILRKLATFTASLSIAFWIAGIILTLQAKLFL
jgi:hypothetical protein